MVARPQTASNCEVVGADELVRSEMLRVEDNNKCAHDSEARESTIRSLGQRLPFSAAPALPAVISVLYIKGVRWRTVRHEISSFLTSHYWTPLADRADGAITEF